MNAFDNLWPYKGTFKVLNKRDVRYIERKVTTTLYDHHWGVFRKGEKISASYCTDWNHGKLVHLAPFLKTH